MAGASVLLCDRWIHLAVAGPCAVVRQVNKYFNDLQGISGVFSLHGHKLEDLHIFSERHPDLLLLIHS